MMDDTVIKSGTQIHSMTINARIFAIVVPAPDICLLQLGSIYNADDYIEFLD
ncbi:Casein kinase/ diadenosine tetraphosphatase [Giardia duodenalis assemblage B]|uniref:Casein kinase/ diadenosine tetraphosphatase n=1 Tax=Giardia duodenalis assemblage B TaxID=1394984 RepID=A0A132NS52_GIAIN|nr:Casein kinase/ diadenosine tetraphosphatase [Giardia intestinalis assemblage B]